MKKAILYMSMAILLIASMGFIVIGDFYQDNETEESKAYLGIYMGELTKKLAEKYELNSTEGVLISGVSPGSAAAKAGLQRGDVIVAVDGSAIAGADVLTDIIAQHTPGEIIDVTVIRNGRRQTLSVELGERKEFSIRRIVPNVIQLKKGKTGVYFNGDNKGLYKLFIGSRYHLGISYQDLNKGLGEYFGRPDGDGLLVTDVDEESAAAKAGLRAGDVIIGIDGKSIEDSSDLFEALEAGDDDEAESRTFNVEIIRRGETITLSLEAKRGESFNYRYKIEQGELKEKMKELREKLKEKNLYRIHAPEHLDEFIMEMPDVEILEGELEFLSDLNVVIPDFEMLMPEIEMMIPELEMMMPDFEMLLPDFDDSFIHLEDIDGDNISVEISKDGNVIYKGQKFDSIEDFKRYIEKVEPDSKRGSRSEITLVT